MTCRVNFVSVRSLGSALLLSIFVAACGGGARVDTSPVEVADESPDNDSGVITSGLESDGEILGQAIDTESPWELVFRAEQASPGDAIVLRLRAINGFLALEDYANAETQADFLFGEPLNAEQQALFNLQQGRIALGFRDYATALDFLQGVKDDFLLADRQRAVALLALAQAQLGVNRRVDALISLLNRDPLLEEPDIQRDNQQRILGLLRELGPVEQATLNQAAIRNGFNPNLIAGWLEIARISTLPSSEQQSALVFWRNSYPIHPAQEDLAGGISQLSLSTFNHVALLLPISSRYGNAAQAFYDGFIDAQRADRNVYKPTVSLHDIGEDDGVASTYYDSAMVEGADFVVGPLGKDAVDAMLAKGPPPLPTLVIGDIGFANVSPDLYGINLSPEPEAEQVAERAFADGHRQAAVFRTSSDWGSRAANAFTRRWESLGGSIVNNASFPDAIEDYSRIIQRMFEIDQSIVREKTLSAQLGTNLSFTPRRRDDIDMMFFAGNSRQARLLVPQLRFYQALDMPIYGTSSLFAGDINPALDADLDGVVFGDMRWMVDIQYAGDVTDPTATAQTSEDGTEPALPPVRRRDEPIARGPYSFSPLDRLYALGLESYYLVPRLDALRAANWQRYNGQAFNATVDRDGNVKRGLEFATFRRGELELLGPPANSLNQPGNSPQ